MQMHNESERISWYVVNGSLITATFDDLEDEW